MSDYTNFLARKAIIDPMTGIENVPELPSCLFPHQRDIVAWALRRGRAALFAGTGLGKSLMELAWGQVVNAHTGKPILHLAPLAVSNQMVREASKFGIAAHLGDGEGICITNYQKLDHFDLSRFGGIILDESSILKSTDGHYRTRLIEASQSIPFRLAATATPAPNDFMELGNHAEFLGIMSYTDMLATFFAHDGGETQKWRLKGHAENDFWKWMASWAVMLRKPSDLGYPNDGYDLPPLRFNQHQVGIDYAPNIETGLLFPMQAETLQERIAARRSTVEDRCSKMFDVVIGRYCDKLAEWHGNQNTLSAEGQNINPIPMNGSEGRANPEAQKKTSDICGNTERKIPKNGFNPTNCDVQICDQNMASPQSNTTLCLTSSKDAARYADISHQEIGQSVSMLTIAMKRARSEGFFARDAIMASDISRMTKSGYVAPFCIWCNLNSEQDYLTKAFGPLAYSIYGSMADDLKESTILNWIAGERPVMISKPSIMGFGMNFQHCANTGFVGLNDSFEQFYQAVRRFWRFGQTMPVDVDIIASELEGATVANIKRKETDADRMAAAMVLHMADLSSAAVRGSVRETPNYNPQHPVIIPSFIRKAA